MIAAVHKAANAADLGRGRTLSWNLDPTRAMPVWGFLLVGRPRVNDVEVWRTMSLPNDKKRRRRSRDRQIIIEELLRPSHYLGYDRDEMGCYFLGREAFALAESQFRRAAQVNPFEPAFKIHWAVALTHLSRMGEARDLLAEIFRKRQDDAMVRQMWHHFWPEELPPEPLAALPSSPLLISPLEDTTEGNAVGHDPASEVESHD